MSSGTANNDDEFDEEDTEEEVEALAQEMETIITELLPASYGLQAKLTAKLLLKVRGFIAKVHLSENTYAKPY
jgi:hypothetical protein